MYWAVACRRWTGSGPEQLNLRSLFERIRSAEDEVREIILATSPRG